MNERNRVSRPASFAKREAMACGLQFFKGGPCKKGHAGWRYVSTGACRECVADQSAVKKKLKVKAKSVRIVREPEYAERLRAACDQCTQCPPLHAGRLTWLSDEFRKRARGESVSTEACRRWLYGEVAPRRDKVPVLADILGVNPIWLQTGVEPMGHSIHAGMASKTGMPASPKLSAVETCLPVQVRSDVTVHIKNLPHDLTEAEARRLANIILAHAIPTN